MQIQKADVLGVFPRREFCASGCMEREPELFCLDSFWCAVMEHVIAPLVSDRVWWLALQAAFRVVSSFGQNSRSAVLTRRQVFHQFQISSKVTWCLMSCDIFCWFGSCSRVENIYERHWPLIKQKTTQAAQTALSDDSLRWESGHAGSVTADNRGSAKGSRVLFQVQSQHLQHSTAQGCQSRVLRVAVIQHCWTTNGTGQ